MSDPFADLFPRRREKERVRTSREAFIEHARQVLLARWGTALVARAVTLPGGQPMEFPLASGNGRIVGDVAWLEGLESADSKSAALSQYVWVVSHVAADRRFLLIGHDLDLAARWLARHRGMFDGVEVWTLNGDQLERLE